MSKTRGDFESLLERAALAYRPAGRYAYHFARGKLRHDPLFRYVAAELPLPAGGRILDLGCGQGLLFALLLAARPDDIVGELCGIELRADRVDIARRALGAHASFVCADLREARLPEAALIVIADVLLYLGASEQIQVLEKCVHALLPGGALVLREADALGGLRFTVTRWTERLACAMRGEPLQRLHYRTAAEWRAALEAVGLEVATRPMSEGVPFSNVLYVARKRGA